MKKEEKEEKSPSDTPRNSNENGPTNIHMNKELKFWQSRVSFVLTNIDNQRHPKITSSNTLRIKQS